MKSDIIEKIRGLLTTLPISDEPRTVYLLAQVRKVFEHDRPLRQALPTLQFYCNWALHTKLDRLSAEMFLNAVDPVLTLVGDHTYEAQQMLDALLTLNAFRAELRLFLTHNGLEASISDNDEYWRTFVQTYSRVVEDCEITISGQQQPRGPLVACRREFVTALERLESALALNRHKNCPSGVLALLTFSLRQATSLSVNSVTIRPTVGAALTNEGPYPMEWSIRYEDGRTGTLSLSKYGLLGATVTISSPEIL